MLVTLPLSFHIFSLFLATKTASTLLWETVLVLEKPAEGTSFITLSRKHRNFPGKICAGLFFLDERMIHVVGYQKFESFKGLVCLESVKKENGKRKVLIFK